MRVVTENLTQKVDAYLVSPKVLKGVLSKEVSSFLSEKLSKKNAGKLFYLVSDNKAYGVIKVMSGERISKNDVLKNTKDFGYEEKDINKKWPTKEVLYSYDYKLLSEFDEPIDVAVDLNTLSIKGIDFKNEIVLNDEIFQDVVVLDNVVSSDGESLYLNTEGLNQQIIDKLKDQLKTYGDINIKPGIADKALFKLKLEKIEKNDEQPLTQMMPFHELAFDFEEDLMENLKEGNKYVIQEVPSNYRFVIQKHDDKISVFDENEKKINLSSEELSDLKLLYGGDYVVSAYYDDGIKVSDCLFCDEEELTDKNWRERANKLNYMKFTNNVSRLDSTVVDSKESVSLAVKLRSLKNKDVLIMDLNETLNLPTYFIKNFTLESKRETETITTEKDTMLMECQNERFFNTWSSKMAYYLGFITTDGHVDLKNGLVEIMISKQDSEILTGLARALGGVAPKPINNSMRLRWRSKVMLQDLKKKGATGKKEARTSYKQVPSTYTWDFLRGMFDGDGNIYKGRLQMDNSCGGALRWASKHFKSVAGKDAHLYQYTKHWKSPHYKVVVLGEGAKKVHKKLYSRKPYLSRKGKMKND